MKIRKPFTRKRVSDVNVNTALNDIYDKLEKVRPLTKEEVIAMTEPPEEGTVMFTENGYGSSSGAFYIGGQWNVDVNSKYVPANKHNFRALLGSKGASQRIIPGESVFYNKDGNLPIENTSRDKILLQVTTDKLKIRTSDDNNDADIDGRNLSLSGDNLKLGIENTGVVFKNDAGVLHIRDIDDTADVEIHTKRIRFPVDDDSTSDAIEGNFSYDTSTETH